MNNADMPANPINADYRAKVNGIYLSGLTKREHFAGLAMQGILANSRQLNVNEELISKMVILADSLLKALDDDQDR